MGYFGPKIEAERDETLSQYLQNVIRRLNYHGKNNPALSAGITSSMRITVYFKLRTRLPVFLPVEHENLALTAWKILLEVILRWEQDCFFPCIFTFILVHLSKLDYIFSIKKIRIFFFRIFELISHFWQKSLLSLSIQISTHYSGKAP